MKLNKLRITSFLLFVGVISCIGQSDSSHANGVKKGTMTVGLEIGANNIANIVARLGEVQNGYLISESPVYSALCDYSYSKKLSIGILVSYLAFSDNPPPPSYPPNAYTNPETITDNCVLRGAIRGLWHLSKKSNFDFFVGIQGGVVYIFEYFYQGPLNPNAPPRGNVFSPYYTKEYMSNVQVLIGFKAYFTSRIGVQLETGIGFPLEIDGGITFRI
jgi:hypothetical protein